jgi:hypothetical protein
VLTTTREGAIPVDPEGKAAEAALAALALSGPTSSTRQVGCRASSTRSATRGSEQSGIAT